MAGGRHARLGREQSCARRRRRGERRWPWGSIEWARGCARLAAIATLALACGSGAALAAGELRIANSGEPDTLDPHHVEGVWENRIIGDMFLGLTTEAADGSVIPGAAESWEVSDDGTVYTFALRDHTWSDGTPVTADDFVFALRRILDPAEAAEYASLLYTIKNAKALNEGAIEGMDQLGVRALDPKTLEITLESPTPYFIEQLTHYTAFPLPRHKVEELGDDWIKPGNIVGNGAYTVVEWLPNTHVKADKNDGLLRRRQRRDRHRLLLSGGGAQRRDQALPRRRDRHPVRLRLRADRLARGEPAGGDPDRALARHLLLRDQHPQARRSTTRRCARRSRMAIDREAITDKVLRTGELPAYSFVPPGTGNYGEPAYVELEGHALRRSVSPRPRS